MAKKKDNPKKEPKYIRIRYDVGETGWAEDLGEGKAKIANVPLTPKLNSGDIVLLKFNEDDFATVAKVLERAFPLKTYLEYKMIEDFKKIASWLRDKNWPFEGVFPPSKGKPGLLSVSHPKDTNLEEIVKQVPGTKAKYSGWETLKELKFSNPPHCSECRDEEE
jgi:hypothetical protein